VLIVIAAGQLSTPVEDGQPRKGLGLLMVGTIMLLHTTRILSLRDSWPLFIVAYGVSTIFGGRSSRRRGGGA